MEVVAERTTDAEFVNGCANHAEVRPHVGRPDEGALDLSGFLADAANVALRVPHGCFCFQAHEPGRFELHTMLLPEGRGAAVLPAAFAAFRWMFVQTDCLEIVTQVAGSNAAAELMAKRAGFSRSFTRSTPWHDGSNVTVLMLTLDAWRERDPSLAEEGRTFHAALDRAKQAKGSTLPAHPDDEAHDRAAGLACLMAKAGNAAKAVWSYNRWARLAGYAPISIAPAPPVFDIGDALVTFRPELEILECRQQQ